MSALVALSNAFGFASRLLAPLGFTRLPFRLGWKEFAPSAAAPHLVALVALDALMPSFLPEEDAFGLLRLKVLADVVVFIMAGSVSVALARARQPPAKLTLYLSLGRWGPSLSLRAALPFATDCASLEAFENPSIEICSKQEIGVVLDVTQPVARLHPPKMDFLLFE